MSFGNHCIDFKDLLVDVVETMTSRDKSNKKMWKCPIPGCNSGNGPHGTGAFSITSDGKKWRCFSCEHGGDVLDLIGYRYGIPDKAGQLQRLNEICHTDFSFKGNEAYTQSSSSKTAAKSAHKQQEPETDYTEYFARCARRIGDTDYHRGISLETLKRYNIGYDPAWRNPKAPASVPTSPRLIIPTSKGSYLARDTRAKDSIPDRQQQYTKSKAGKMNIFSLEASEGICFIVEGELDALSIIDCGGQAVGLGSVSNAGKFLEHIGAHRPQDGTFYIIALDNDKKGNENAAKLEHGLEALNIPFYRAGVLPGRAKDANEALMQDRQGLTTWVKTQIDMGGLATSSGVQVIDNPMTAEQYDNAVMADKFLDAEFMHGIAESVNTPVIPTGFEKLDLTLDGGLYEGLYVVGGVSSLGKTSFVMQIVDQVATAGHDVFVFSLEMSRAELVSKSLSRLTMIIAKEQQLDLSRAAKTPRGITDGKRYRSYTEKEIGIIDAACKRYKVYAKNIGIRQGVGNIGVKEIRKAVLKHIAFKGKRPVVVIDYLQILAPVDIRATDKQNTDRAVLELKRLSRDLKIPVVCISSLNRASYNNKISMEAFKESGAIEYSSDVLLGLQFKVVADGGDIDTARYGEGDYGERMIQCVVLKNRYGRTGGNITYTYNPCFNYFSEESGHTFDGKLLSKKKGLGIKECFTEAK